LCYPQANQFTQQRTIITLTSVIRQAYALIENGMEVRAKTLLGSTLDRMHPMQQPDMHSPPQSCTHKGVTMIVNEIKLYKTQFSELRYAKVATGLWRIFDVSDGRESSVGPHYPSKDVLLSDLHRYGTEFGATPAA
jgi:hypothetical protein